MLSEYAVEPATIGSDWRTFKDLIDRFGGDKGRLISRFPQRWERKVIQAAKDAGVPDIRVASIVERLRDAAHKIVDFERAYSHELPWIDNVLNEHAARPFRAVVCTAAGAPPKEGVGPDDCSDAHPLFAAAISRDVNRTADEIANALHTLVAVSEEVDIVDPYFDLRPAKNYLGPLVALLSLLAKTPSRPKALKIHFRDHESRPPPEIIAADGATQLKGVIPQGYCIELYAWSQKPGGEDFHDRFVLTELGGIMVGAGLSAHGGGETAAFTLLDVEHASGLRGRFAGGSTVYERIGKAIRFRDDGVADLF